MGSRGVVEEQECTSCDAIFVVEHEMDTHHYVVMHCPFCGEHIERDEFMFGDEDEDE
jgi:predicted RNA-binding Zn-ribbon protein involved in translation (DUF1610 family)